MNLIQQLGIKLPIQNMMDFKNILPGDNYLRIYIVEILIISIMNNYHAHS